MSNSKGTVGFLAIIALVALGLSGYMFVGDEFLGKSDTETGNLKLVAFWDELDENLINNPDHNTPQDFLIEFQNQTYLDTEYVTIVNNTRFMLAPGIYKINVDISLYMLSSSSSYWVNLNRNGSWAGFFVYHKLQTSAELYTVDSGSLYINNTSGENYYELNARGSNDFSITTSSNSYLFNQFSIEYVSK